MGNKNIQIKSYLNGGCSFTVDTQTKDFITDEVCTISGKDNGITDSRTHIHSIFSPVPYLLPGKIIGL